jgi:hypothetical protein
LPLHRGANRIIHIAVDEARLKGASNRVRNQFVGCMHAHNEVTILNRLLMFTMNNTGDGELHNSAQSVQMWFMCNYWRPSCSRLG